MTAGFWGTKSITDRSEFDDLPDVPEYTFKTLNAAAILTAPFVVPIYCFDKFFKRNK